jgi:hypothetical protein
MIMTLTKFPAYFLFILSLFLLAQIGAASFPPAQMTPARPSGLTDQQWREDIDFLAKTVAEKHRHPFDTLSRADFDKAVAALRDRVPALADHEVVVGMIKLVAMLRDGHSRLTLPAGPSADTQSHTATATPKKGVFFNALPVRFYLFSDGLYVQTAAPDKRDLVGARVVRIEDDGRRGPEAIRPAVHYDPRCGQTRRARTRIPEIPPAASRPISADACGFEKDG